jgi:hypothetical protein
MNIQQQQHFFETTAVTSCLQCIREQVEAVKSEIPKQIISACPEKHSFFVFLYIGFLCFLLYVLWNELVLPHTQSTYQLSLSIMSLVSPTAGGRERLPPVDL